MNNDKTPNVWVNPVYLHYLKALEMLTGRTPSEAVNDYVEDGIKMYLDDFSGSFSAHVEGTAEKLGVKLEGIEL